jgi:hypothetical protein
VWLQEVTLPAVAREQITVALRMIDALDAQLPAKGRGCLVPVVLAEPRIEEDAGPAM